MGIALGGVSFAGDGVFLQPVPFFCVFKGCWQARDARPFFNPYVLLL